MDHKIFQRVINLINRTAVVLFIFSLFINLFSLVVPLYMIQIYDRVLISQNYYSLFYLTLIVVITLLTLTGLDIIRANILTKLSIYTDKELNTLIVSRCPDEILQGNNQAPQLLKDLSNLRQFLAGQPIITLFDVPWIPVYLIALWLVHPAFFALTVIIGAIILAISIINAKATSALVNKANQLSQQFQVKINAIFENSETIQAMGMMGGIIKHTTADNDEIIFNQAKAGLKTSYYIPISKMLRLLLQVLTLGLGAILVINHEITAGLLLAATIICTRAVAPFEQLIATWKFLAQAKQSYLNLNTFLEKKVLRESEIKLPVPKGHLLVKELSYSPPGTQKKILHNVFLEVKAGEMWALIGPSASGKSSLAKLIVGALKPTHGIIRLDHANVYTWPREQFGQHVGYVSQDVQLFEGTVAHNIARLHNDTEDPKIIDAAKMAGAHEMILSLPSGYQTMIAAQMKNISGGQRQRIALARALYGNPTLIILDEPDANLDIQGTTIFLEALKKLKESGSTIIVISHRSHILQLADKVALMQGGTIVKVCTGTELLNMNTKEDK